MYSCLNYLVSAPQLLFTIIFNRLIFRRASAQVDTICGFHISFSSRIIPTILGVLLHFNSSFPNTRKGRKPFDTKSFCFLVNVHTRFCKRTLVIKMQPNIRRNAKRLRSYYFIAIKTI